MNRGRQRRELPHRAVAVVRAVELDRRKQERNRGARHEVIEAEVLAGPRAAHAAPLTDGGVSFEENPVMTPGVGRRRECEGV
jgi:hypothetical protein